MSVTESDPDVTGQFGQEPDLLASAESTRGVISKSSVGDHGVEEGETFAILDRT